MVLCQRRSTFSGHRTIELSHLKCVSKSKSLETVEFKSSLIHKVRSSKENAWKFDLKRSSTPIVEEKSLDWKTRLQQKFPHAFKALRCDDLSTKLAKVPEMKLVWIDFSDDEDEKDLLTTEDAVKFDKHADDEFAANVVRKVKGNVRSDSIEDRLNSLILDSEGPKVAVLKDFSFSDNSDTWVDDNNNNF